ncbi:hypothetical protein AB0I51_30520 [Streptomyces sp. NPDC050549]|uniref:hypothetical protein n=1 Tax=Streptomyces sp. NPDC050549 TaxID=3155406 RepID=UPI003417D038
MFPRRPLTMSGSRVRLEPLSLEHAEGLWAASDDEVFAKLPYDRPPAGGDRIHLAGTGVVGAGISREAERLLLAHAILRSEWTAD